MFNSAFSRGRRALHGRSMVEELTGIYIDHTSSSTSTASRTWSTRSTASTVCIPRGRRRPGARHLLRRRHPGAHGPAGAQLRPRAHAALGQLRHRPDEAAAGVHRLDGQQGDLGQHADQALPGLQLPRGGHDVDHARPGARRPATSWPTWPGSSATPTSTTSSSSPCRSWPTRPTPTGSVWAPEADELWERIIADKPLNKKLSGQVVTASDPVGGSASPSDGASESPSDAGTPGGDVDATATENGLCA